MAPPNGHSTPHTKAMQDTERPQTLQLRKRLSDELRPTDSLQLRLAEVCPRVIPSYITDQIIPLTLSFLQQAEPQPNFSDCHSNTDNDEYNNDPGNRAHFGVCNAVTENLRQLQEDPASFIKHLDARADLEVLAGGEVERVQGWF